MRAEIVWVECLEPDCGWVGLRHRNDPRCRVCGGSTKVPQDLVRPAPTTSNPSRFAVFRDTQRQHELEDRLRDLVARIAKAREEKAEGEYVRSLVKERAETESEIGHLKSQPGKWVAILTAFGIGVSAAVSVVRFVWDMVSATTFAQGLI